MIFIYYHIDFSALLIAVDSFRKVHFASQVLLILWVVDRDAWCAAVHGHD